MRVTFDDDEEEVISFLKIFLLVGALFCFAVGMFGQQVPFPTTQICTDVSNPVKSLNPAAGAGGYSGDNVVEVCQWGPCSYNITTHAIWQDQISVYECKGKGRYPVFTPCDTHQSVSFVIASPFRGSGLDTYIASNVVRGNCSPTAPSAQFYTIHNGISSWTFGADANLQAWIGWTGSTLWLVGSPCTKVDYIERTVTQGSSCPGAVPFNPIQKTDTLGRTWQLMNIPNGIQVASGPSPTPISPSPTSLPLPSSTPTPVTISSTPTPAVSATPTPTPQYVCQCVPVTVTPAR